MNPNLDNCHMCDQSVAYSATTCPHCGAEGERHYFRPSFKEAFDLSCPYYYDIPIGKHARVEAQRYMDEKNTPKPHGVILGLIIFILIIIGLIDIVKNL
ncbi:MAG: hypothetical protein M2R45_03453 [Verrucomicrobia subdivision 3 bacterium]|nr:hypothetical protein [Limisphaerales bacterium]MCS1415730.1 hypothetical protein [Limisphaerales bacterium]